MKKFFCIVMAALMISALCSCSGKGSESFDAPAPVGGDNADMAQDYDVNNSYGEKPGAPSEDGSTAGEGAAGLAAGATERKRIQYVTIEMETLEYDTVTEELKARVAAVGGYVDSARETGQSVSGRGARRSEYVFRIPTGELDGFTAGINGLGNVLSQYTTTDDVTDKYFDTEARLAALKLERDKYMELLDRADNMDYIISLTNALSEVNYKIELYTGTLNKYDSLIAYSTVTVNITEVVKLTDPEDPDPSFGQRLTDAFSDSLEAFSEMWQGVAIGLTAAIPFLIIPAAAVVIVAVVLSKRSKKRRRMMAESMAAQNPDKNV